MSKKFTDEELRKAVKENHSIAGVLRQLKLKPYGGGNYKTIHRKVAELDLETSHWRGQGHLKGETHNWTKSIPLEKILVENSTYTNIAYLKKRLVKEGLIEYKCEECNINNWRNKKLVLHLDHINGINNDHRIENLRFLCPNCHSQTPTYCGRNIGNNSSGYKPFNQKKPKQTKTSKPKKKVDPNWRTKSKPHLRKVERPDYKTLKQELQESNYTAVGRKYGVSDNAVRKWMRFYEK